MLSNSLLTIKKWICAKVTHESEHEQTQMNTSSTRVNTSKHKQNTSEHEKNTIEQD